MRNLYIFVIVMWGTSKPKVLAESPPLGAGFQFANSPFNIPQTPSFRNSDVQSPFTRFPTPGFPSQPNNILNNSCPQNEERVYPIRGQCAPTPCSEGCPNSGLMCTADCKSIPVTGVCKCRQGFFRLANSGNCVPESECNVSNPGGSCPPNEQRLYPGQNSCAPNACTEGCPSPNRVCTMECKMIPINGVCVCKRGFVRLNLNTGCVSENQCNVFSGPGSSPIGGSGSFPIGGPGGFPIGGPGGFPFGGPGGIPIGSPGSFPIGSPGGFPVGGPGGFPIGGPNGPIVGPTMCQPNEVRSTRPCLPTPCDEGCPGMFCNTQCVQPSRNSIVCTCQDGYVRVEVRGHKICVPNLVCRP